MHPIVMIVIATVLQNDTIERHLDRDLAIVDGVRRRLIAVRIPTSVTAITDRMTVDLVTGIVGIVIATMIVDRVIVIVIVDRVIVIIDRVIVIVIIDRVIVIVIIDRVIVIVDRVVMSTIIDDRWIVTTTISAMIATMITTSAIIIVRIITINVHVRDLVRAAVTVAMIVIVIVTNTRSYHRIHPEQQISRLRFSLLRQQRPYHLLLSFFLRHLLRHHQPSTDPLTFQLHRSHRGCRNLHQ
jgi:hypothetical protein